MTLSLLFAALNNSTSVVRETHNLHFILASNLHASIQYRRHRLQSAGLNPWQFWVEEEEFKRYAVSLAVFNSCRTYFAAACFIIELHMLKNIPVSADLLDSTLSLPCSEEEWVAETAESWSVIRTRELPPTPPFNQAFQGLFVKESESRVRYSEFGGYVAIWGICLAITIAYKSEKIPGVVVDFTSFDVALDNWQRSWNADPNSQSSGPGSTSGAMPFNASAVYRLATIRRAKDYSRYFLFFGFYLWKCRCEYSTFR